MTTKRTPMDIAAVARIMSAAAKRPGSKTAQDGFGRRTQSAGDKNTERRLLDGFEAYFGPSAKR
ncbi:hypothetical protein ACIBG7_33890 [Nonomuraea sp. NPDC050328]|uniref:hypothetical protein n=1 Tax=Nonomuraea sp. NPDC050328 TaxID=3364361 RepID=UPI0037A49D16